MKNINDKPHSANLQDIEKEKNIDAKMELFHCAIHDFVQSFISIPLFDSEDSQPDTDKDKNQQVDRVRAYAIELLTLGVVLMELNDSIQGDGPRLLRVWKLLMLIFPSTGKTKYSIEALVLEIQVQLLPDRLRHQLLYSRFVNTRGKLGKNIPIDLHLEHVNRLVKASVHSQSSNLSPTAIKRTTRCTGSLINVTDEFDKIGD